MKKTWYVINIKHNSNLVSELGHNMFTSKIGEYGNISKHWWVVRNTEVGKDKRQKTLRKYRMMLESHHYFYLDSAKTTVDSIPANRGLTLINTEPSVLNYYEVEPLQIPVIDWSICFWVRFGIPVNWNTILSMVIGTGECNVQGSTPVLTVRISGWSKKWHLFL